jgi:hypothetical protein
LSAWADYLLSLKGIGPYTAAHCRILLHDFSRIPVDSVATAYLRERYGCDPAAFAADRSSWADYLALGYTLARLSEKLGLAVPPNQNETSGGKSPGLSPNLVRSATINSQIRPIPRWSSSQAEDAPEAPIVVVGRAWADCETKIRCRHDQVAQPRVSLQHSQRKKGGRYKAIRASRLDCRHRFIARFEPRNGRIPVQA